MSDDLLHRALLRHRPATVKLYVGDECTRTINASGKKKQWEAIENVVAKLQWDRLEMYAKDGSVLDVIEIEPEPSHLEVAAAGGDRDAQMLKLMIQAQREVMTFRSKEQELAMRMLTQAMGEMTAAVHGLVQVHNLQIAGLRQFYQTVSKAAPAAAAKDDFAEAIELAKIVLPQLSAAKEAGGSEKNGHNGHSKEQDK